MKTCFALMGVFLAGTCLAAGAGCGRSCAEMKLIDRCRPSAREALLGVGLRRDAGRFRRGGSRHGGRLHTRERGRYVPPACRGAEGGRFTEEFVLTESLKAYPLGEVYDEFCRREGVPTGTDWLKVVQKFEKDVQLKRI